MKKRFPLQNRKKMLVTLVCLLAAGLFGYVESVIPVIFVSMPFARVHLAILFALFLTACYSPLEGGIAWGVRCVVFGLCVHSGAWLLADLFVGLISFVVVWLLLKTGKFGLLSLWPVYGICFAFLSTCAFAIMLGNGSAFSYLALFATFVTVNVLPLFVGVYVAIRYIPQKLLIDDPITQQNTQKYFQ